MTPAVRTLMVAACALLAVACLEPELSDDEPEVETELPEIADEAVVDTEELLEEVEALMEVLARIDALLADAARAETLDEAHALGRRALAELVEDEELTDGATASRLPLLPATTPDRATTPERPALLISALTAAQDQPSALASELGTILADDVAGDLGGWQRDAEGMVASARDVARGDAPLAELETAVLELPGEGLRAVAWTLVVAEAPDLERVAEAAERARAHIGLMHSALEEATS